MHCEAFYQKFNTNANFLRYSLPSFRQRYSRIMRVGGILFYERRALIAAAALAINRPKHIVRRAAPIFRSVRIQPLSYRPHTHTQMQPTAKIKIIPK